MVGCKEDVLQLKHRLTSQRSAREIIPIVGMGGIGKTTLARNLYNDPLIVSHFDVRAWATVSQDYSVHDILSSLLGNISDNISPQDLGDKLHKRLCGRRYLVVLDDIWSEKAWDEIQRYFPKEGNRSRILITSRELAVAKHPDPDCEEHQMHLLSDAQGWDLLRQMVFGKKEHCPHILEEIGKQIASSCGGLPLALSVIGGLLSVDKYSKDLWDQVSRDIRSITDNHISEILCVIYDNLPLHLKPCFLMSAFPEDYKVRRSKLVKLLVAEGFLWRSDGQKNNTLEDVAEEYLKALVDRNLLTVTNTKYNGRAESYSMDDLLRDLCARKAEEEKFLRIFEYGKVNNFRRLSIHHATPDLFHKGALVTEDLSCSRSLLCYRYMNMLPIFCTLRLVRVLDVYDRRFNDFPEAILKLPNLRFLAVYIFGNLLPSAIWRLRNLQTLKVRAINLYGRILPYEAWEISGLRHIILPESTICIDFKIHRVQENLQTICGVCLRDLLASNLIINIPNIKKLEIYGYNFVSEGRIIDLSHLHKLETLKLKYFSLAALSLVKLPNCLKKLYFYECNLPMGIVNGIGDLQYLEVLMIRRCWFEAEEHSGEEEEDFEGEEEENEDLEEDSEDDDFEEEDSEEENEDLEENSEEEEEEQDQEWELNEEVEFSSLQFLSLQYLKLKRWKADYSNFPRLRHLEIRFCYELEEIPDCFGETSTLETIEVDKSNRSHVAWANEATKRVRE